MNLGLRRATSLHVMDSKRRCYDPLYRPSRLTEGKKQATAVILESVSSGQTILCYLWRNEVHFKRSV